MLGTAEGSISFMSTCNSHDFFPLTPAVSRGETENHLAVQEDITVHQFFQRVAAILPLVAERAGVRGTATFEESDDVEVVPTHF
jgi:hypothetical protein